MRKIGTGRTAEVFLDNDGSAVKLFYGFMPATEAEYEAVILQEVSKVCGLAPKHIGLCNVEGRNGLRFEYIEGRMAGELMLSHPAQLFKITRAMGLLHREIHSAKTGGLRRGEDIYCAGVREYQGISAEARNTLLDFIVSQKADSLCHGDFHPENILIGADGKMRVIDWVNSYSGDPLSDVARTYYLIRHGLSPNKRTWLERVMEYIGKPIIANAYLHAYFNKKKFPKKEFRLWLLVVMIHRFVKERIPEEEPGLRKALAIYL